MGLDHKTTFKIYRPTVSFLGHIILFCFFPDLWAAEALCQEVIYEFQTPRFGDGSFTSPNQITKPSVKMDSRLPDEVFQPAESTTRQLSTLTL
jgi:hypothetical protein